jgi:hypothetical protein
MTEVYNSTEIRYANKELFEHCFVKEEDYEKLQEEVEILRAERSHWYHLYNQEKANQE